MENLDSMTTVNLFYTILSHDCRLHELLIVLGIEIIGTTTIYHILFKSFFIFVYV